MSEGYIYVRTHPAYSNSQYNACKLGKASNIPERDSQYATGELIRGDFKLVIEFDNITIAGMVERMLQRWFTCQDFHVKYDAGTEFYKQDIITQIVPYLEKTNIAFRVLSPEEINALTRTWRLRKVLPRYIQQWLENKLKQPKLTIENPNTSEIESEPLNIQTLNQDYFTPRSYQTDIITKALTHLQIYAKGLLILTCGVGKTLISLWIALQIITHITALSMSPHGVNSIIIGVPNISLLKQWYDTITKLFRGNIHILTVSGGTTDTEIGHYLTHMMSTNQTAVVLTTYSSSHKVNTATRVINYTFGIKILDETHHLTTENMSQSNTGKTYIQMLNIPAVKQLALTATIKQIDPSADNHENIISNDNVAHFGEIIERKCLLWAIQQNIICDYVIQTVVTEEDTLNEIFAQLNITTEDASGIANIDLEKRMFLSAYTALKSICFGCSHHLLIYSNCKENSHKLIHYIKLLLDAGYFTFPNHDAAGTNTNGIYYSSYHSDMSIGTQADILKQFEAAKYGIITCVYCLGEGWDFPLLDGVVFSENMTSNIRIVQSALRASRKHTAQPNKIAKIILPIYIGESADSGIDWFGANYDNKYNTSQDLQKVRRVIYQMGLEDETIAEKIKVSRIKVKRDVEKQQDTDSVITSNSTTTNYQPEFGEYDADLTEQLLLKTTARTSLGITYERARRIIADKGIKSKEEYYELCKRDIRLTKDPEYTYKAQFTNWVAYLSIPRIYYNDVNVCRAKINEYMTENIYTDFEFMEITKILTQLDTNFPPFDLWCDYYNINDLSELFQISVCEPIVIF